MSSSGYKIILREDPEFVGGPLSPTFEKPQRTSRATTWCLVMLLFASLSFNVMWIVQMIHTQHLSISDIPTKYSKNPQLFCSQALSTKASQAGFEGIWRFHIPSIQSIPTATELLQTKPGATWSRRLVLWLYRTTGHEQKICPKLNAFLGTSLKASTFSMLSITFTV